MLVRLKFCANFAQSIILNATLRNHNFKDAAYATRVTDDSTEMKKYEIYQFTTVDEVQNDRMFTHEGLAYGNPMSIN